MAGLKPTHMERSITVSPEVLVQAGVEDAAWDRVVLGERFDLYERMLRGDIPKRVEIRDSLTPLQQVLLANAYSNVPRATAGDAKRLLEGMEVSKANVILSAAIARYETPAQLSIPWISPGPGYCWTGLNALYLTQLTGRFDDSVSVLLYGAQATGRLTAVRRHQLNGLLFHPLQNADQHGRNPDPALTFAGVSARIVKVAEPKTPSITEYFSSLADVWPLEGNDPRELLELIVHDNGSGIATHFYNATREPNDPDLDTLPLFNEWGRLNNAFERHQTSKPVGFRRATTGTLGMPGVGLAGLLRATKQLRAYFELRTGRLRVFQWYRPTDVIPDQNMLRPPGLPAAAPALASTVFRFFVPLDRPLGSGGSME
jgi:hypothetical protein